MCVYNPVPLTLNQPATHPPTHSLTLHILHTKGVTVARVQGSGLRVSGLDVGCTCSLVQGYLAHTNHPPPRTLQLDYA